VGGGTGPMESHSSIKPGKEAPSSQPER